MQQSNQFSSTFGFLMAATGFAVGLGNIWRFPYITGENGGGAFVVVYLGCALMIGIPILIAEILIGRRGQANPPKSMQKLAEAERRSPRWIHAEHLNLATAFVIRGTYCVVSGWALWYLFKAISTGFVDTTANSAANSAAGALGAVMQSVDGMFLWTALSLVLTGTIIYYGVNLLWRDSTMACTYYSVNKGIERSERVMMPKLFPVMAGPVIYNAF